MIKHYKTLEQNTPEWLQARCGVLTASVVKDLLTKTFAISKGKMVDTLACNLASQRITKRVEENFQTYDMKRGHIEEELALEAYGPVDRCGFITNDYLGFTLGFSPDGLLGDNGMVEVKSRKQKFQVETFCAGEVPSEYMIQCQTGMLVAELDFCDFIQFSNGMPLFVKRVEPIAKIRAVIIEAAKAFEVKVQGLVDDFSSRTKDSILTEWVDHDCDVPEFTVEGEF